MAGRSNVGKSTLINALCRSKIARTSAAPGKTRLANIYRIAAEGGAGGPGRWALYLVDLPGYGYARGGAELGGGVAGLVAEAYFAGTRPRSRGRAALLLVDARHPGWKRTSQAARWLDGDGRRPARRRDQDRQAVARRAGAQPEDHRDVFRNGRPAGIGSERRRIGCTVDNDRDNRRDRDAAPRG